MLDFAAVGFPPVPQPPGGTPPPPAGGFPQPGVPPAGPPAGPPPGPSGPYLPPPGGGGGSWFDRHKNWFLPVLGGLVVLIVVATFLVLSEDEANADEIFLEPIDFEGDDPFTEPVTVDGASALGEAVGDLRDEEDGVVQGAVHGSEPGLYGGTLNQAVCDREQLVDFLGDNADKANAFADVLGIDVDDIPDYVAELTPVVLRGDTRVTNHGFADGEATPFQAVLEAGTAVLVDVEGIPRVKCFCGNPLTEPIELESPTYSGDEWDGWDPADIQVTSVDVDVDIFVITDVINGGTFTRPAGTDGDDDEPGDGEEEPPPETTLPPPETTTPPETTVPPETTAPLGTGDVQVTLRWGGGVDLDLHVIDPSGTEISYSSPTSPSGGQLDTDAQSSCSDCVENVFWPTDGAPLGDYQVFVVNFTGDPVTDYTLEIRVGGEVIDSQSSSVGGGAPQSPTTTFTVS